MPDDTVDDPRQIIADLQRQLVQYRTERDEALAQQTATAEVLQVINSSPGDLAPVFEAMLERAVRLCEFDFASLWTYDGSGFHPVARHRVPDPYWAYLQDHTPPAFARLVGGDRLVHIADVRHEAIYQTDFSREVRRLGLDTVRSILLVPLRKGEVLLGVITAYRREVRPFTDKQIALLENFAAQAVIAMENARLISETREALEQQTATAEVLQVINSSPGDLAPVFDAMLEKAIGLSDAAAGTMMRRDGERFSAVAVRGASPAFADFLSRGPFSMPSDSSTERVGGGEPFVHFPDVAAEAHARQGVLRTLTELSGARTYLAVPLRKDDALLGVFSIYRLEVRPFSDKQIALVQNFAAQAVIAMENARLITETREALEQQTATAEVLQVINSSPGDLAPVFDAMLEKATRLCEAPFGILRTWDGKCFHFGAVYGEPRFRDWVRQRGPIRPDRDASLLGRIVAGERVVHFADAPGDEGYRTVAGFRDMVEASGIRSAITVALHKDDALLGTITVYRQEVRPFSDKQIALLQNFAAQAVIAMENARLITETREALEQQTATAEVLGVINSSPGDLAPVFDAILEKAHSLCGIAFGSLQLYEGGKFRAVAVRGAADSLAELLRQPIAPMPGSFITRLLGGERFVQITDIAAFADRHPDNPRAQASAEHGLRTALYVPLRRDADFLGYITAFRQEVRPFSDKEIALLENFAAQAVIAIENARLITETREALEQQTATAEVLQVINSSPGDLAPVFDAMLQKALRLCEATYGQLSTYDGDCFDVVAIQGEPRWAEWVRRRGPAHPTPGTTIGRIVSGERLVHVEDISTEEAYLSGNPTRRALVEIGGFRTLLSVALRRDETVLGVLHIYRQEVRPFSDKQVALLQNFAAQAVIAMENARLLGELRARTDEIAGWNRELEERVAAQLGEIERTGRLKRFLAPQLAELIVAQGDESILESHRREIVVVFCDLRGFTTFAERAEPEEVMALLRDYHAAMGPIVASFEGTLDHYAGDGIMVFFNDPLPTPEPAKRAIEMAVAMRKAAAELLKTWHRHGHDIGFGVGISQGYATLGQIGFAERMDYTAIGTVTNLAARLCGEAQDGQILISRRVATAVEDMASLEEVGDLSLKGLSQAVAVYNVQ